jgi:hypothetical protein
MGNLGRRLMICAGLLLVVGAVFTAGASAKPHCANYTGGAAGVVDKFTNIKASGVSCDKAHEVLGTWANSAPGGTDLGFSCKAKQVKGARHKFHVTCTQGSKRITALDTQKL